MRIYLDHCAYNRPFDDQNNIRNQLETMAKLYIQGQIKEGKYDLVWSYMSNFENNNPNEENKYLIQEWEKIAKYTYKSSDRILELGKQIEQNKIHSNDALHIACAIESQCAYFITTDSGLTNKEIDAIKVVNPIDFIREMEEKHED